MRIYKPFHVIGHFLVLAFLLIACDAAAAQDTVWNLEFHPFRTLGGIDTSVIGILKDGEKFLTGHYDETNHVTSLQLRDFSTGKLIRTIFTHNDNNPNVRMESATFQHGFDRIMIKWQTIETKTEQGGIGVRFTDRYLFSFLDAQSGKEISQLPLRYSSPNPGVFSGNGKRFAIGTGESGQSEIFIYDIESGQRVQRILPIDRTNSWDMGGPLKLSHNGDKLLVSEQYPNRPATHHIFDVTTGNEQSSWTAKFRDRLPRDSWLSPDGDAAVVENKVFNATTGKESFSFSGMFLQFSKDGKYIVTAAHLESGWNIVFLDGKTGSEVQSKRINLPISLGDEPTDHYQRFPNDGRFLTFLVRLETQPGVGSSENPPHREIIVDMENRKVLYSGKIPYYSKPNVVAIAPDGKSYILRTDSSYQRRNVSP